MLRFIIVLIALVAVADAGRNPCSKLKPEDFGKNVQAQIDWCNHKTTTTQSGNNNGANNNNNNGGNNNGNNGQSNNGNNGQSNNGNNGQSNNGNNGQSNNGANGQMNNGANGANGANNGGDNGNDDTPCIPSINAQSGNKFCDNTKPECRPKPKYNANTDECEACPSTRPWWTGAVCVSGLFRKKRSMEMMAKRANNEEQIAQLMVDPALQKERKCKQTKTTECKATGDPHVNIEGTTYMDTMTLGCNYQFSGVGTSDCRPIHIQGLNCKSGNCKPGKCISRNCGTAMILPTGDVLKVDNGKMFLNCQKTTCKKLKALGKFVTHCKDNSQVDVCLSKDVHVKAAKSAMYINGNDCVLAKGAGWCAANPTKGQTNIWQTRKNDHKVLQIADDDGKAPAAGKCKPTHDLFKCENGKPVVDPKDFHEELFKDQGKFHLHKEKRPASPCTAHRFFIGDALCFNHFQKYDPTNCKFDDHMRNCIDDYCATAGDVMLDGGHSHPLSKVFVYEAMMEMLEDPVNKPPMGNKNPDKFCCKNPKNCIGLEEATEFFENKAHAAAAKHLF